MEKSCIQGVNCAVIKWVLSRVKNKLVLLAAETRSRANKRWRQKLVIQGVRARAYEAD